MHSSSRRPLRQNDVVRRWVRAELTLGFGCFGRTGSDPCSEFRQRYSPIFLRAFWLPEYGGGLDANLADDSAVFIKDGLFVKTSGSEAISVFGHLGLHRESLSGTTRFFMTALSFIQGTNLGESRRSDHKSSQGVWT